MKGKRGTNHYRRTPEEELAGTRLVPSMGHSFGAGLNCMWCGESWKRHQDRPKQCPTKIIVLEAPSGRSAA